VAGAAVAARQALAHRQQADMDEIVYRIRRCISTYGDLNGSVADALKQLGHSARHASAVVEHVINVVALAGAPLRFQ
jgi:hypothetical protein